MTIHVGDCREVLATLEDESVQCCVTSPPYWGLRDYGVDRQMGREPTLDEFLDGMVDVFREVRRVLRDDGTLWLNMGDSYTPNGGGSDGVHGGLGRHLTGGRTMRKTVAGLESKNLIGVPWRLALALQADGWWLRRDIVWHKTTAMPESTRDRPHGAHEFLFLLSKSKDYHYAADAVRTPLAPKTLTTTGTSRRTKNGTGAEHVRAVKWNGMQRTHAVDDNGELLGSHLRSVWSIASEPYAGAHFATMPTKLVEPCILAGCPRGGTVLDPFAGAGTVGLVAHRLGREFVGIELNPEYARQAEARIAEGDGATVEMSTGETQRGLFA